MSATYIEKKKIISDRLSQCVEPFLASQYFFIPILNLSLLLTFGLYNSLVVVIQNALATETYSLIFTHRCIYG